MRLVMSARPKPQTRNRYDKRIVEDIVQHVVDGKSIPPPRTWSNMPVASLESMSVRALLQTGFRNGK